MEILETIFQMSPLAAGAVPVVLGVVQIVKGIGLPSRYAPLASLVLGVGIMFLVPGQIWQADVVQGLIVGLAASGLWSGVKATING